MSKPLFLALTLALVAAACERPDPGIRSRQLAGQVLRGTLAYPRSAMLGVSAGADAAELRMASPDSAPAIAAWFRTTLSLNGWQLEHDAVNREGAIVIYAEQGKRPLWITVRPNSGGPGATYTMIGAVVEGDSIR